MGKRIERDPRTGKRVLRFVATSAVVVAPISLTACGGATGVPEATNVDHHQEQTNVDHSHEHANPGPEEEAPEATNADHTAEPHSNLGPEAEEGGAESGGDEESVE